MEKILFLTNALYLDTRNREGGVRNCTNEFIELLSQRFEVIKFPVTNHITIPYRLRVRLGLNHYNDYKPEIYRTEILEAIRVHKIRLVFLNLSNTVRFSSLIKEMSDQKVKVILCSHGNETGDFLHQVVRFPGENGYFRNLFSSYTLGRLLKIEAAYRLNAIDMVLTVSPVEENLEKWLGSGKTFMVPRVIKKDFLPLRPVPFRVGFLGDISHTPNQSGVLAVCNALMALGQKVEFRLVGGPEEIGRSIEKKYPFVKYLGFLNDEELREEAATWAFFLNLVFYYSRGVSTKLAKALGWGIPVLSTIPGNRGYHWAEGDLLLARDAQHMAELIVENAGDPGRIEEAQQEVIKIVSSSSGFTEIMDSLYPQLMQL